MAKAAKASVNYRTAPPHCGVCKYFTEIDDEVEDEDGYGRCQKVNGQISEDMLCDLFERGRSGYKGD
jgi:hypothetical protein